jgi:hypothetical protein
MDFSDLGPYKNRPKLGRREREKGKRFSDFEKQQTNEFQ